MALRFPTCRVGTLPVRLGEGRLSPTIYKFSSAVPHNRNWYGKVGHTHCFRVLRWAGAQEPPDALLDRALRFFDKYNWVDAKDPFASFWLKTHP